jgi:hypothetical protein
MKPLAVFASHKGSMDQRLLFVQFQRRPPRGSERPLARPGLQGDEIPAHQCSPAARYDPLQLRGPMLTAAGSAPLRWRCTGLAVTRSDATPSSLSPTTTGQTCS